MFPATIQMEGLVKNMCIPGAMRAVGVVSVLIASALPLLPVCAQDTAGSSASATAVGGPERTDTTGVSTSSRREIAAQIAPHAMDSTSDISPSRASEPVLFRGDTVFSVHSPLGEFLARERAVQVTEKLRFLARASLRQSCR